MSAVSDGGSSGMDPLQALQPGDALIVVDVQKDFCPGGKLAIEGGDGVVSVMNAWIEAAVKKGVPIYASRDWHPPQHPSFREEGGPWPPHCLQDSDGATFHDELELPEDAVVVTKGTRLDEDQNSAFHHTGLAAHLRRHGVRRIWVGGLAQDVCVAATVLDGRAEGFDTGVIVDATRPVTAEGGREALRKMTEAGARPV